MNIKKYRRLYYKKNKNRIRLQVKKYRDENIEKIRKASKIKYKKYGKIYYNKYIKKNRCKICQKKIIYLAKYCRSHWVTDEVRKNMSLKTKENWNLGKFGDERNLKISKSHKYLWQNNEKYKSLHRRTIKMAINEAQKTARPRMLKLWKNDEFRKEQVKRVLQGCFIKPNKKENLLLNMIKENNFPYICWGWQFYNRQILP